MRPTTSAADASAEFSMFMEQYIATANGALRDKRLLQRWSMMFSETCTVCAGGYETAASVHAAGHTINGGELIDYSISTQEIAASQGTAVVAGSIEAAEIEDAEGQLIRQYQSVEEISVVYTARQQPDGTWLVIAGNVLG